MPWCPKCKVEHREGFNRCNDCDVDLVEELENHQEELDGKELEKLDSEVFLISARDDIHTKMIEAKLNDNGIPVLKKHPGAGGYLSIYMGATNLSVDLYVPSKLFEQAKEILLFEEMAGDVDIVVDPEEIMEEEILIDVEDKYKEKKKNRGRMLFLLVLPGLIWLAYIIVTTLIDKLL